MHANKLKSHKNMQKFPMLLFRLQNRILICIKIIYKNNITMWKKETSRFSKTYLCYYSLSGLFSFGTKNPYPTSFIFSPDITSPKKKKPLSSLSFALFFFQVVFPPFFQPPVLFLFMQSSHVPCFCSNHHFLLSPFNHPPPQLLICSIASIAAMASGWSHLCHASYACSFMEVVLHCKQNIFNSSPG